MVSVSVRNLSTCISRKALMRYTWRKHLHGTCVEYYLKVCYFIENEKSRDRKRRNADKSKGENTLMKTSTHTHTVQDREIRALWQRDWSILSLSLQGTLVWIYCSPIYFHPLKNAALSPQTMYFLHAYMCVITYACNPPAHTHSNPVQKFRTEKNLASIFRVLKARLNMQSSQSSPRYL